MDACPEHPLRRSNKVRRGILNTTGRTYATRPDWPALSRPLEDKENRKQH